MDLTDLGDALPAPKVGASAGTAGTESGIALHELAGQIGAEVATPLSSALERVTQLATTGQIGRRGLRALREEIEQARRVAMMGQQISRLASGRVTQAPERLDLPQLLRDMITQRGPEIEARGLEVRQVLRPAAVQADPTLMFTLLQALVDWSFEHCCGRTIHLVTDVRNWPIRSQLMCEFAWRQADQIDTEARTHFDGEDDPDAMALDTMAWRLVETAARTMGVVVERSDSPWQARLLLEFTHSVEEESSHHAPLIDMADPERLAMNSEPLAGSHVLVVSPRREVRNQVREAVRTMGMMVDYVTSREEAREFCRGGMPHAVIYDGALAGFDALKAELRAEVAGVAFLEITEATTALEVAASGMAQEARVGLKAIVGTLPSALIYALSIAR